MLLPGPHSFSSLLWNVRGSDKQTYEKGFSVWLERGRDFTQGSEVRWEQRQNDLWGRPHYRPSDSTADPPSACASWRDQCGLNISMGIREPLSVLPASVEICVTESLMVSSGPSVMDLFMVQTLEVQDAQKHSRQPRGPDQGWDVFFSI